MEIKSQDNSNKKQPIEENVQGWPQSGTIMSDAIIDTLKIVSGKGQDQATAQISAKNAKSRAQVKKKLPQSGSIMSDAVIDGLKASAKIFGADRNGRPQSGTPVSDHIIDGLKVVKDPPSRAQLE